MNWLIITNDENIPELDNVIHEKFKDSILYKTSTKKEDLLAVHNVLAEITHAVILVQPKNYPEIIFLTGFLCGIGVNIYSDQEDILSLSENYNSVQYFESYKSMTDFISEKSGEIIDQQNEDEAYDYLYQKGYPFDADNFAHFIENWNKKICECYVTAGMDVNSRDKDGTPMLNIAARGGNVAAIKWLIDHGADLNAVSKDRGYTAIMDAVFCGNEEITKYLIKKGSDLNTVSKEGQTMLILAVGAGRTGIVKMLADSGADPDIADGMGMSAYGYANLFKKEDILAILEKYHKE